jgi:hypothetical protein
MDDELQNLSEQVYTSTFNLIEDGNSPLAVAAMYAMVAMQIYRTSLSEEDYNTMVDEISAMRSQVRLLTDFANQKTLN